MYNLITFSIAVFTGFFAIMNPIANVPIFLSLVQNADNKTKEKINKKATITAFLISDSGAKQIIFKKRVKNS